MKLKIKLLNDKAKAPAFATEGAACFDLVNSGSGCHIPPGGAAIFSTGIAVEIMPGFVMQIFSRSGHGFKNGIVLVNGTGIIDSDYRGEIKVGLRNEGSEPVEIKHGERIAQAMIVQLPHVQMEVVSELSETARGTGGFGSTGTL